MNERGDIGEKNRVYVFSASEFQNDSFHPAAFVSKFRESASLENLRDQLRDYCHSLKSEVLFDDCKFYSTVIMRSALRHYQQGLQGFHYDSDKGTAFVCIFPKYFQVGWR